MRGWHGGSKSERDLQRLDRPTDLSFLVVLVVIGILKILDDEMCARARASRCVGSVV